MRFSQKRRTVFMSTDASTKKGSTSIINPIKTPDYMHKTHQSDFVERIFKKTDKPDVYTNDFIDHLYAQILTEKQLDVELNNKRRVTPEKLDINETLHILLSLFDFRRIRLSDKQTSKKGKQTMLGVYNIGVHNILPTNIPRDHQIGIYDISAGTLEYLVERVSPKATNKDIKDLLGKIERLAPEVNLTKESNLVPVNNGVFDKSTKELLAFSDEYVFISKLPINYKEAPRNPIITMPDGASWDVESWIDDLMDNEPDKIELVWQVIADTLQSNHSRNKTIWFYSESGNSGKGTLGDLIRALLGPGNYSSLSVVDFNHEFMKSRLIGASANIADENDVDAYIDSVKDFKASITGDPININIKYEEPIDIEFLGTNIQMMNGLPRVKDKSGSWYRRLIILPFTKTFTNNGERFYIKDDYIKRRNVLEYVLHKALNIDFTEFISPKESIELLENYKVSNDPVRQYWDEFANEFQWDLLPTKFLYDLYISWFKQNNPSGSPLAKQKFMDELSILACGTGEWENKTTQKDTVRTGTKMAKDEPLITQYDLYNWMNHKGRNDKMKRQFIRSNKYRGLKRL